MLPCTYNADYFVRMIWLFPTPPEVTEKFFFSCRRCRIVVEVMPIMNAFHSYCVLFFFSLEVGRFGLDFQLLQEWVYCFGWLLFHNEPVSIVYDVCRFYVCGFEGFYGRVIIVGVANYLKNFRRYVIDESKEVILVFYIIVAVNDA